MQSFVQLIGFLSLFSTVTKSTVIVPVICRYAETELDLNRNSTGNSEPILDQFRTITLYSVSYHATWITYLCMWHGANYGAHKQTLNINFFTIPPVPSDRIQLMNAKRQVKYNSIHVIPQPIYSNGCPNFDTARATVFFLIFHNLVQVFTHHFHRENSTYVRAQLYWISQSHIEV